MTKYHFLFQDEDHEIHLVTGSKEKVKAALESVGSDNPEDDIERSLESPGIFQSVNDENEDWFIVLRADPNSPDVDSEFFD